MEFFRKGSEPHKLHNFGTQKNVSQCYEFGLPKNWKKGSELGKLYRFQEQTFIIFIYLQVSYRNWDSCRSLINDKTLRNDLS